MRSGRKPRYADHRRARAGHLGAQSPQVFLEGPDLRLPGGVIDDAFAFGGANVQADLLAKEGVIVKDGKVDLKEFVI